MEHPLPAIEVATILIPAALSFKQRVAAAELRRSLHCDGLARRAWPRLTAG